MDYETQFERGALGCQLAAEVANGFGRVRLRVTGTSMAPALRPGDMLAVEPVALSELSVGDIVVFARGKRLIAHRVISKAENVGQGFLITRGDRVRRNDAPISSAELIGRVTGVERGGRPVQASAVSEQALGRLLLFSDRATALYLRLAEL